MAISDDVKTLSNDTLPALAASWRAWADDQVAAARAELQAQLDAADAVAADLQAQLEAALTKLNTALAEAQQDHADEVAALNGALAAAAPPASAAR